MIHQGIPQPLASPNSGVPQFGSFQSQSTIQPNIHWANQQVITFLKHFAHHNLKFVNSDFALNVFSFRKYKMPHNHKMKQTINLPNQTRLHYSQVLIIPMSCPLSQVRLAIQIILMPMGNNSRVLLVCLQNQLMNLRLVVCLMLAFSAILNQLMNLCNSPCYYFLFKKQKTSQVLEKNVAEHVVYDEQQKAFKEQDSPSNVNIRTGMVEHQEKTTESKVFILLCVSCLAFHSFCEHLTLSSLLTTRMKELQLTSNLSLYLGSSINLQIFLCQLPRFTSKIMQQNSILML